MDMKEVIEKAFDISRPETEMYSPLVLAYVGDCVYELTIRTLLVDKGNAPVNKLNRKASSLAKAATQSAMITAVYDTLTPQEQSIYKRGRNAKSFTTAKNASVSDYRRATGFEALIGSLYLDGNSSRAMEIIKNGFMAVDADILK